MSWDGGTVKRRWKAHESKSVTWISAGQTYTTQKIRVVDMRTIEYVGVFSACPSNDNIEINPTKNDNEGDVIYDSVVQYNPITGKAVKTNTVRSSVNASPGHEGGWHSKYDTGSS